jgi:ATP-dependent helicase/nuclease subunit A
MTGGAFKNQVIRASAGSGKTHQLTTRYLALLAAGVEADAILATTFTRKAAGEILDRVLERLALASGETTAAKQLAAQIGAENLGQADFVRLLRRLLQNLNRVRIGTLDSFFMALAGSFIFELGLRPGWSICEDADNEVLWQEAIEMRLQGEDLNTLAALYERLVHGQAKSGVERELLCIVRNLYRIHQETDAVVWNAITVPPSLPPAKLNDLLNRIEAFDLSKLSRMPKARGDDLGRARSAQWKDLLDTGLSGKVFSGQNTFHSKPIPLPLITLYSELLRHARSALIKPLAEQTTATREFLDGVDAELRKRKQATGALIFDEVTQALVDAVRRKDLLAGDLAFRLDGTIEHLLLDEFQDTSLAQWRVLLPIAKGITQGPAKPARSFFCVGDVKQAIYGWRGGMAEIFGTLQSALGPLEDSPLVQSRRSAQPIIDVVNYVFGGLGQFEPGEKYQTGVDTWSQRFERHTTVKKDVAGYVCVQTGPAQEDGQRLDDQRLVHCGHVAAKIRDIVRQVPGRSIGVLCRKNDTVARMIFELRRLGVEASEEGGNALTDSPAVEVILSLLTLADHPGHSVAWFHLKHSPLQAHLKQFGNPDVLARHLRRELLANGYGQFVQAWAERLAPACDWRDLSRLQQLVEMAYGFETRSTLRADDFVDWVRFKRVPDPSSADVRVMTIHGAKGLQFDVVVLPELDNNLGGQAPAFVVGRDKTSLEVNLVCRYAEEAVRSLLTETERAAFEQDRQGNVEESLSLLYVAMTRAINALHIFIPGPRGKFNRKDAWYNLLLQTLAPEAEWLENTLLFEHGDAKWFEHVQVPTVVAPSPAPERPAIAFRAEKTERRRGMERVAPSQREGQGRIVLDGLFHPSEGTGTAAGRLFHAWFETIKWRDDGVPTDGVLRSAAEKLRVALPAATWNDLDKLLGEFRGWLQDPLIGAVLRRSAYANPQQTAFPSALAPIWTKKLLPQQVERERRFLVRDGATFWNGSLDRIVWLGDEERTIAADVIDFKTDAIAPGDEAALAARTDHYRPQVEAYRKAVARLAGLPPERVAARLVFTFGRRVVEV